MVVPVLLVLIAVPDERTGVLAFFFFSHFFLLCWHRALIPRFALDQGKISLLTLLHSLEAILVKLNVRNERMLRVLSYMVFLTLAMMLSVLVLFVVV